MVKKFSVVAVAALCISCITFYSSCKWFKKEEPAITTTDTSIANTAPSTPINNINLPHADSSLIPILTRVLDEAFEASTKKDYAKLGSLIVYRGPDQNRYGYAVYNTKNSFDRKIVSITGDVFNKWNKNVETRECARIFALPQPDGRELPVLEVLFISEKNLDRKFFGFLEIDGSYKIADVTSYLQ